MTAKQELEIGLISTQEETILTFPNICLLKTEQYSHFLTICQMALTLHKNSDYLCLSSPKL